MIFYHCFDSKFASSGNILCSDFCFAAMFVFSLSCRFYFISYFFISSFPSILSVIFSPVFGTLQFFQWMGVRTVFVSLKMSVGNAVLLYKEANRRPPINIPTEITRSSPTLRIQITPFFAESFLVQIVPNWFIRNVWVTFTFMIFTPNISLNKPNGWRNVAKYSKSTDIIFYYYYLLLLLFFDWDRIWIWPIGRSCQPDLLNSECSEEVVKCRQRMEFQLFRFIYIYTYTYGFIYMYGIIRLITHYIRFSDNAIAAYRLMTCTHSIQLKPALLIRIDQPD